MRIIAGELRGRPVEAPPGRATRPMLDRVREALFSILGPWLPQAVVLDLYAGSGSLGIEALSRGARSARFVERAPDALRVLRANLARLGLEARATVVAGDALDPAAWGEERPDVALLDPPYPLLRDRVERPRLLASAGRLARAGLAPEGVLVLHAPRGEGLGRELGPGLVTRERAYGTSALWLVQPDEEAAGDG